MLSGKQKIENFVVLFTFAVHNIGTIVLDAVCRFLFSKPLNHVFSVSIRCLVSCYKLQRFLLAIDRQVSFGNFCFGVCHFLAKHRQFYAK